MKRRGGFTLIEMLVVIAIIGVLLSLLLPAVQRAKAAGRLSQCQRNMQQIAAALHSYDDMHRCLPPGSIRDMSDITLTPPANTQNIGFMPHLLGLLEQEVVFQAVNWKIWPGNEVANTTAMAFRFATFICPANPSPKIDQDITNSVGQLVRMSPGSYVACMGSRESAYHPAAIPGVTNAGMNPAQTKLEERKLGLFYINSYVDTAKVQAMDGMGKTMMLSEARFNEPLVRLYNGDQAGYDNCKLGELVGVWGTDAPFRARSWFYNDRVSVAFYNTHFGPGDAKGDKLECELNQETGVLSARSYHDGVVNVMMGDGGVRQIANIDIEVWRAIGTWKNEELNTDF